MQQQVDQNKESNSLSIFTGTQRVTDAHSESVQSQPSIARRTDSSINFNFNTRKIYEKKENKNSVLPEIECFAINMNKSARMLMQALESMIICKQLLVQDKLSIEFY